MGKSKLLESLEYELLGISPDRKIALAFSAGVDSTILLCIARKLNFDVLAVTFDTKLTSKMVSISGARECAEKLGARFIKLPIDTMSVPQIAHNDKRRCYYCKSAMFEALRECAAKNGYQVCCDGTNADDLKEYRPGLLAKAEYGIKSPIAQAGITKAQIREIGRELGLEIASKPSSPCLLTRFPYDTAVTADMLEAVEQGEGILKQAGFMSNRLRIYGDAAKVEIPLEQLKSTEKLPIEELKLLLAPIGVRQVTVDETGLKSGRMDEEI